jgi:hypothetical protein
VFVEPVKSLDGTNAATGLAPVERRLNASKTMKILPVTTGLAPVGR